MYKSKLKDKLIILTIFIVIAIVLYGIVNIISRIIILEDKLENLNNRLNHIEMEYDEIWSNIDALSEDYTLIYNKIYKEYE